MDRQFPARFFRLNPEVNKHPIITKNPSFSGLKGLYVCVGLYRWRAIKEQLVNALLHRGKREMNRAILIAVTVTAASMINIPAQAEGFDWGETCSSGEGEFEQYIAYYSDITVGEIPAGKANVEIQLRSPEDVDVRLIDTETGHQIIAWPNGNLNGAGQDCTIYHGVNTATADTMATVPIWDMSGSASMEKPIAHSP